MPDRYGLVQPPAPMDPIQTLSGLMTLGRQMESYRDEDAASKKKRGVEAAMNEAKGDPDAAAGILEQRGDWSTARTLREGVKQERLKTVDQVIGAIDGHKDVLSRSAEFLNQITAKPDLYPQLRPKLVELAAAVNPELANFIPEAYDPTEVRNMLTWVNTNGQATNARAKAAADAKLKLTAKDDFAKSDDLDRKIASNWFSVSPSQEDWDQSLEAAKRLGVSSTVLGQIGPTWSKDATERARAMGVDPKDRKPQEINTLEEAIVKAQGAGDTTSVNALVGLQKRLSEAKSKETNGGRHAPTAMEIAAVMKNPTVWAALTPTMREDMLGPLAQSGFDFKAAASQLTDANRSQIERWKVDQLDSLEKEFAERQPTEDGIPPLKPVMTADQLNQRKMTIENGYRSQLGMPALTSLPASWRGGATPKDGTPPVTATPAPKPAAATTGAPAGAKGETRSVRLSPGQPPMVFTKDQWTAFVAKAKEKGVTISTDPFASQ